MVVHVLGRAPTFPAPRGADSSGLVAIGGDLRVDRLHSAYCQGIFPWYSEGDPILWWCPDPRMVLFPEELHVPRSLRKTVRRAPVDIRWNTAFDEVVEACAAAPRPDQDGTWITEAMKAAYRRFHDAGHAMSVEAWEDGSLVAGLYGVSVGRCFFGESMFTTRPDGSKLCLIALVEELAHRGVEMIDCQMRTDHLARFGAREIERWEFLERLEGLRGDGRPVAPLHVMGSIGEGEGS